MSKLHLDGTKYATAKPVDMPLTLSKELRIQDMWVGATAYPADYVDLPDINDVQGAIDNLSLQVGDFVWIDIEHWDTVNDSVKLDTLYGWIYDYIKSNYPGVLLGSYGLPCSFSYNDCRQPYGSTLHHDWILGQPTYLVKYVDVLMPQCYHFYRNLTEHEKFIKEYMRMARSIAGDRKVIPFLWFTFHEGADFGRDAIISSISSDTPPIVTTDGAEPVSNLVNGDMVKLFNMNATEYDQKYFYVNDVTANSFTLHDIYNNPIDGSLVTYIATGSERIAALVPVDHFLRGLEIADEYADGFIVWGGGNIQPWIDDIPWYNTLKTYLGI